MRRLTRVVQRRRRRMQEQRRSHALDTRLGRPAASSAAHVRGPDDGAVEGRGRGTRTTAAVPRKPGADPVRVNTKRARVLQAPII